MGGSLTRMYLNKHQVGGIASKLGLLTSREKEEVKERLQAFRRANPQVTLTLRRTVGVGCLVGWCCWCPHAYKYMYTNPSR